MEARTRFTVDAAHCERAVDELHAMLVQQEQAFIEHWYSGKVLRVGTRCLQILGYLVALVGLGLSVFATVIGTARCGTRSLAWFIPLFVIGMVLLYFAPRWGQRMKGWSLRRAQQRGRRHAQRFVRTA